MFRITFDAGDFQYIAGYAYDLEAAKWFAVNRELVDGWETDALCEEDIETLRGEWRETIRDGGKPTFWTNGYETIEQVKGALFADEHPAVAEVARLTAEVDRLRAVLDGVPELLESAAWAVDDAGWPKHLATEKCRAKAAAIRAAMGESEPD